MKIVFTGGPCAGKTSIADFVAREYSSQLILVEEAASLLFRGHFPRASDPEHLKHEQLAIYFVQRELEAIAELETKKRTLLCDRGSLDSLAYWPGDISSFLMAINSTLDLEIARYDWVLHFETNLGAGFQSNGLRTETLQEAVLLNEKLKTAWRVHPRRLIINGGLDFLRKTQVAIQIVGLILNGYAYDYVRLHLNRLLRSTSPQTLPPKLNH